MTTNNLLNESLVGIQSLTSTGVFNGRTITGTANQIAVSNGNGTGGNPTLSLTSPIQVSGISFDSGSNTLSAYSDGTWTPSITGTTPPTVAYAANGQIGYYTKVGTVVFINFYIQLTSISGGDTTNFINIPTLPFVTNASGTDNTGSLTIDNTTDANTYSQINIQSGSNNFAVISNTRAGNTTTTLKIGSVTNTSKFRGSAIYQT